MIWTAIPAQAPYPYRPLTYCTELDLTPEEIIARAAIRPRLREPRRSFQGKQLAEAYLRYCARFCSYAPTREINAQAPKPNDVADYLEHLRDTLGESATCVRFTLTSIRTYVYTRGNGHLDSTRLRAIARAARKAPRAPRRVLDYDEMQAMLRASAYASPLRAVRARALILFFWHSLMRPEEVANLTVADFELTPGGAIIYIRSSKTDQAGEGQNITIACTPYHIDCPVHAVLTWLEMAGITEGYLFRSFRVGDVVKTGRIGCGVITRFLKGCGARVRLQRTTGIAFRRGGAREARRRGATEPTVQRQLRHYSAKNTRLYTGHVPVQPNQSCSRLLW